MSRPMIYTARCSIYFRQCSIYFRQPDPRGWWQLTARQGRQLERMAGRETYRDRGELAWTPPPLPRGYGLRAMLPPLRGSFATHIVQVAPGQKARHGNRISREATP